VGFLISRKKKMTRNLSHFLVCNFRKILGTPFDPAPIQSSWRPSVSSDGSTLKYDRIWMPAAWGGGGRTTQASSLPTVPLTSRWRTKAMRGGGVTLFLLVAISIVCMRMEQKRIRRISFQRMAYPLFAIADEDDDPTVVLTHHEPNLRNDRAATSTPLPIHIVQPSANRSSVLSWRDLASVWDRNATFDTLARMSRESTLPIIPPDDRVVIILHTSPKMGSLTLRLACRQSLIESCGITSKHRVDPDGFRDGTKLAGIIRECTSTHHFCLKSDMFPDEIEIERFENTSFFHLYPFRNYDDWTISALKHEFYRGGAERCKQAEASMDACHDTRPELAFFKYTKAKMSRDLPHVERRVDKMRESHHFVLYPYAEIDELLSALNKTHPVPMLPGSAEKYHAKRPEGTCDGSILDKFHECFTHKLDKLP